MVVRRRSMGREREREKLVWERGRRRVVTVGRRTAVVVVRYEVADGGVTTMVVMEGCGEIGMSHRGRRWDLRVERE